MEGHKLLKLLTDFALDEEGGRIRKENSTH